MPKIKEKLCSLSEAANLIKNGTRITFGGMSLHNHPMAFIYEIIRKGVKDLTIVGHVGANEVDILVGASCVKRIEISYVGLEEFGLAPNYRRAVEKGQVELVEYSEPVCFERFNCSANGQSFFPSREMIGTDIPKYNSDIREMTSPFDGKKCHLVPAADPEWVVIHAPMADKYGNVLFFENRQLPENLDLIASRTTRNLIVTAEEIVERNKVFQLSHLNMIPRFRTAAVVKVPYGAHPSSFIGLYEHDKDHLEMYTRMARTKEDFKEYLDKYIYGKTHMQYLDLIGIEALMKIRHVGGNL